MHVAEEQKKNEEDQKKAKEMEVSFPVPTDLHSGR